jgi:uncharacterized protein YceK
MTVQPKVYPGVQFLAEHTADAFAEGPWLRATFWIGFCIVDGPFDILVDTLWLPFDVYFVEKYSQGDPDEQ